MPPQHLLCQLRAPTNAPSFSKSFRKDAYSGSFRQGNPCLVRKKNKNQTKTTTSCCWVLNGVSSLWLHLTLSFCGRRRAIQNNPEIRIISEVQKPLVYQDTTMTKDDDLLPLRMAPLWDMRLPGRHPPNTPCAHPSRGSNHTSELIQRSCMELRIRDTRVSTPIITGFVDLMVILW